MSNGRPWSRGELERLRTLARAGNDDAAIGEELGRDRTAVAKKRREHQIEPGQSPAYTAMVARVNLRRRAWWR